MVILKGNLNRLKWMIGELNKKDKKHASFSNTWHTDGLVLINELLCFLQGI